MCYSKRKEGENSILQHTILVFSRLNKAPGCSADIQIFGGKMCYHRQVRSLREEKAELYNPLLPPNQNIIPSISFLNISQLEILVDVMKIKRSSS